jgi:beta-lactamase class A
MSPRVLEIIMQKILLTRILLNPLQRFKYFALILHNKEQRNTHRNTLSPHLRILIIQRLQSTSTPTNATIKKEARGWGVQ